MALNATHLSNVVAGAALLTLSLALLALSRQRAGRLLSLYTGLTGAYFLGLGVFRFAPLAWRGELVELAHIPLFFAFLPLAMYAAESTGIHARAWRKPWVWAPLLLPPLVLVALEIPGTGTIVRYQNDAIVQGPLFGVWMAVILLLTASFVYAAVLAALALARTEDPSDVAPRALLLAAFIVPAARVLRELMTAPYRWTFLTSAGLPRPILFPDTLAVNLLLAGALSLAALLFLRRCRTPRAREAAGGAVALATLTSLLVVFGENAQAPVGNFRWAFFSLLLTYAALRHGLLGSRRVALRVFELPLAAAGFGIVAVLCAVAFGTYADATLAVSGGIALALVAASLVAALSGSVAAVAHAGPRYSEERDLGGGRARVTLALDTRLHRNVVLKRLPGGHAALAEARAAARVSHPSLVAIHDVLDEHGAPCLVLEHVPGGTLEDRLRKGPFPPAEARRLAVALTDGLAALHAHGLVHGDVKAGNVLLRADGSPALGDFGSARAAPGVEVTLEGLARAAPSASLSGVAPEVLRGEPADARADAYGLSALLYRLLTGQTYIAFPPTLDEARDAVLRSAPRLPHPLVPQGWEALLSRGLAKEPGARPASMGEMRKLLEQA